MTVLILFYFLLGRLTIMCWTWMKWPRLYFRSNGTPSSGFSRWVVEGLRLWGQRHCDLGSALSTLSWVIEVLLSLTKPLFICGQRQMIKLLLRTGVRVWWGIILKEPFTSGTLLLFSRSVMSNSLRSHGLQHARLPCPSPSAGIYSNSHLLSRW